MTEHPSQHFPLNLALYILRGELFDQCVNLMVPTISAAAAAAADDVGVI